MNLAYRIYLGARNAERRAFSPRDIAIVEDILNAHFQGWTTVKAVGCWLGETEETLVITITGKGVKSPEVAVQTCIEACARRLKDHLGQESVMIEEGGTSRFF